MIDQPALEKALHRSWRRISLVRPLQVYGSVTAICGALVECSGISHFISLGDICYVATEGKQVMCEVIGANSEVAKLMPFEESSAIRVGNQVQVGGPESFVYPCMSWKGRIINSLCQPVDAKGDLKLGKVPYVLHAPPVPFHLRGRVGSRIELGTRAIDVFVPCCFGQRLGIFASAGVGKSTLIATLARNAAVDIKVIGLVGERSREIREFIDDYLGQGGLSKAVVIASTGDQSPIMKRRAAYLAMATAEYFCAQGLEVLCMIDSLTRFAAAQREIGLTLGEFPVSRGYTPSVFGQLPKLLERAGPGPNGKSITGLFTILVDGDEDPIGEALRATLDGHIILSREIAERNRFPAVDVLKSISRTAPACYSESELKLVEDARKLIASYSKVEDLLKLGIYKAGSDPETDLAIAKHEALEEFLRQAPGERETSSYDKLAEILK